VSVPQALFLLDQGRESVYGGAARGGKSDALLAAALQYVDVPGYAALILRRTFPELRGADGLLARSHAWLRASDARWNEQTRTWTFPSGALLEFGHVENELDRFKFDGRAYQYIGFDELTSFVEEQYDHIGFTRSSPQTGVPVPLRTRGSCTPTGAGVGWVKKRFITHRAPDVTFVPASVVDNPGVIATDYAASLARVPEDLRRRLLFGDWDAFEGAAFPNFNTALHVVGQLDPPAGWLRFESMDFGAANPSCVLAWAAYYDCNLVVFDSIYTPKNTLVSDLAAQLAEKRAGWWPVDEKGWQTQSVVCHADPSMWASIGTQTRWGAPASIVTELREHGIDFLSQANNKRQPGRVRLLELMRPDAERLFPQWHPRSGEPGSPRLFIVGARCVELVEQLSAAPANDKPEGQHGIGEVVQGAWESQHGHAVAAARYGAMSWQQAPETPPAPVADPRAAALRDMVDRERQHEDEIFETSYAAA
jgi:Terminase large subunit, T4likevirus-type, N-terminal